jgi:hypothetical protein
MMNRKLNIVILFLLILATVKAESHTKWTLVDSVPNNITQTIGGANLSDYWLVDKDYSIYHFANNIWLKYSKSFLFGGLKVRSFHPFILHDRQVMVLLVDMDWKTHFASINRGKVIRYAYVADKPVYHLVEDSSQVFVCGNFGVLVQLIHGEWKQMPTPIHTHIHSAVLDAQGKLWLGTNGEGVFQWDGVHFKQYAVPEDILTHPVIDMQYLRDTLFVNTSNGTVYAFYKQAFHPVDPVFSPFFEPIRLMANGYYKISFDDVKHFEIPYFYKIKSFKVMADGHALLLTQDHQLFYNQNIRGLFFLDFAPVFGLDGPRFSYLSKMKEPGNAKNTVYDKLMPGVIWSDFNNDHYPDLLFFNISDQRRPYLYINNQRNGFTNFADPLGLNNQTFNGTVSRAFDVNGDGRVEIITTDYKKGEYVLKIYEKMEGIYQLMYAYRIPDEYSNRPVQQLSLTDVDSDGDLDLALVFGYSQQGKGSLIFLKNNGYGSFDPDTSTVELFKGWNVQAVFADFNGDGLDDVLLIRNWGSDVIYFRRADGHWNRKSERLEIEPTQQRKGGAWTFDFDNDGDLDIFILARYPFIRVFRNDGMGHFENITANSGLNGLNNARKGGQMTVADFDNDGFQDIFLGVHDGQSWKNYLFLNDSAKGFVDASSSTGLAGGSVEFAAAGDIDRDGDMDLYAYKKDNNVLWINNLDSNNFLQIRLIGVRSNTAAIGAKVWLYEDGHLDEPCFLVGYRELGSKLMGLSYQNERVLHFGVDPSKQYVVKIQFPGGKISILKNISTGTFLSVSEIKPSLSWWFTWDNRVVILLRNRSFRLYALVILLGLLFLWLSISYGTRKFNWDASLTSILILFNVLIFGILLAALSSLKSPLKYYLPLLVIVLGSFGPVGFYLWIKNLFGKKSQKALRFELFESLLNFSHGSWASSNLNSLQLFFENLSINDLNREEYKVAFQKRRKTFLTMTLPVVEQIVSLARKVKCNETMLSSLQSESAFIKHFLTGDISGIQVADKEKIASAFQKLRALLAKFKRLIFASYSSDPLQITESLGPELDAFRDKENGKVRIMNLLDAETTVLVDAVVLADILDNCIQNARKAMRDNENRKLTIKWLDGDVRIFIEVVDNGKGIPESEVEKIFENGFSTTGSSGYGLYHAREMLSKYGGRIYVKSSIPNEKTSLVIELQKGIKK